MFLRRYTFYLLFTLAYTGFLLLEKQWYSIDGSWLSFLPTFLAHFLLMVLMVYTNTALLIPHLFQKKRIGLYIISTVLLIALFTWLRGAYHEYIYNKFYKARDIYIPADYEGSFVYAVWFTVVSSMLFITQKWFDHRQQVKNIEIAQLQTELKYLRAQINPHFLFNGLNTIYGNIDMANQQARDILLQFSDLLRYNLYEADVDLVDLGKEAGYLENYVSLQRARSNENLQVDLLIDIKDNSLKIAPLIFIVFVENAFKFSTRDDNRLNYVKISLSQSGNKIEFSCANSCERNNTTGGIGLANVMRRLELLYKDRYNLAIEKGGSAYTVDLILYV